MNEPPSIQDRKPERVTSRGPMVFCDTDWQALTDSERLNHLQVEGYAVIPRLIDAGVIDAIKTECADLPMNRAPYCDQQTFGASPPQWHSRSFAEIMGHPRLLAFLHRALGDELVFMLGQYICSGPGVPGLALHSDYQPFGSAAKGWNESSPATLRVLIYLDDLTPERAPFTILPRSHLSVHQQSNPYRRFDNHPEMKTVCLDAGGAIVFNVKAFHGTHPNTSDFTRTMIEYAFRPEWARCAGPVEEWEAAQVASAPAIAKPLLKPRNSGLGTNLVPEELGDAPPQIIRGLSPMG